MNISKFIRLLELAVQNELRKSRNGENDFFMQTYELERSAKELKDEFAKAEKAIKMFPHEGSAGRLKAEEQLRIAEEKLRSIAEELYVKYDILIPLS